MQNKAVLYGIGAIVIVVAGVGIWMFAGKGPNAGQPPEATPSTQSSTLKDLLARGGSNKCTFTSSTQNSQSQGTVYISDSQMRGDFSSVAAGKTIASHMIVKDNTSYVWSDAAPQGFKMSFDAMTAQSDATPQAGVDPNAQVNYSCAPWSADASLFALPTSVTFQDMSSLVPGSAAGAGAATGTSIQGSAAQCGQCDQIPDASAKAQCRAALHC
jgi:hypothetical protein